MGFVSINYADDVWSHIEKIKQLKLAKQKERSLKSHRTHLSPTKRNFSDRIYKVEFPEDVYSLLWLITILRRELETTDHQKIRSLIREKKVHFRLDETTFLQNLSSESLRVALSTSGFFNIYAVAKGGHTLQVSMGSLFNSISTLWNRNYENLLEISLNLSNQGLQLLSNQEFSADFGSNNVDRIYYSEDPRINALIQRKDNDTFTKPALCKVISLGP